MNTFLVKEELTDWLDFQHLFKLSNWFKKEVFFFSAWEISHQVYFSCANVLLFVLWQQDKVIWYRCQNMPPSTEQHAMKALPSIPNCFALLIFLDLWVYAFASAATKSGYFFLFKTWFALWISLKLEHSFHKSDWCVAFPNSISLICAFHIDFNHLGVEWFVWRLHLPWIHICWWGSCWHCWHCFYYSNCFTLLKQ